MGFFDDSPPDGYKRSSKGWLKPKPNASKNQLSALKSENNELKSRLEQLEAAVEQLVTKKKK